jgi:hypothetical protein
MVLGQGNYALRKDTGLAFDLHIDLLVGGHAKASASADVFYGRLGGFCVWVFKPRTFSD